MESFSQYEGREMGYGSDDVIDVRQVHKNVPSQNFHRSAQGASTLETMRLAIEDLTGMVKGMVGSLKSLQSEVKELRAEVKELRSQSPQNRYRPPARVSFKDRPRSPSPKNGCFICGSDSHFRASCPQRRVRSLGEETSQIDFVQDQVSEPADDYVNEQQDFHYAQYRDHNP